VAAAVRRSVVAAVAARRVRGGINSDILDNPVKIEIL